ncbi:FliM/FliN family flagellar motor switch protein [Marivita sp. S0852]|uniref:FliM/FliN family flagellar motor switch protein n=1 Tax=Marivita sp. S0852 TaxID=3373893 RepID=UPI0039821117
MADGSTARRGLTGAGALEGWTTLARLFDRDIPLPNGTLRLSEVDAPPEGAAVRSVGSELFVALAEFPFAATLGAEIDTADLPGLPPLLARALEDAAFAALRDALGVPLPQVGAPVEPPAGLAWIAAEIAPGWDSPARLLIGGTRAGLSRAARRLPDLGPHPLARAAAEAVQIAVALHLGQLDLTVNDLRGLRVQDALLPHAAPKLCAPGLRMALSRAEAGWTIEESQMTQDDDPSDLIPSISDAPRGEDPALADLDDLPVRLTFVLADTEMTLADLRDLAQGGTIPFDSAPGAAAMPGDALRILANGRGWGRGTLIDIDGAPAVRITSIDTAPNG